MENVITNRLILTIYIYGGLRLTFAACPPNIPASNGDLDVWHTVHGFRHPACSSGEQTWHRQAGKSGIDEYKCVQVCENGGTYNDGLGNDICDCPSGYTGTCCTLAIDDVDGKDRAENQEPAENNDMDRTYMARNLTITCDDELVNLFINGQLITGLKDTKNWRTVSMIHIPSNTEQIAVECRDLYGVDVGILASTDDDLITDSGWKCTTVHFEHWHSVAFDDSSWSAAHIRGKNGDYPWRFFPEIDPNAKWIWSAGVGTYPRGSTTYCRQTIDRSTGLAEPTTDSSPEIVTATGISVTWLIVLLTSGVGLLLISCMVAGGILFYNSRKKKEFSPQKGMMEEFAGKQCHTGVEPSKICKNGDVWTPN